MNILCATDFSENSDQAAKAAALIASACHDSLQLTHVIDTTSYAMVPEFGVIAPMLEKEIGEAANKRLQSLTEQLQRAGISLTSKVLHGAAADTLVHSVTADDTRMIVMASHGARAPARWLMGSVAEGVMQHSRVPVLILTGDSQPLLSWKSSERPLRVLIAIDNSDASDAALEWLADMRKHMAIDATFTYLYFVLEEYTRLGLHGPRPYFDADPEVIAILERDLNERIKRLAGTGKNTLWVRPHWGQLGSGLSTDAQSAEADIVVVGSHQRSLLGRLWHGSIANKTLRSVGRPMLCVPSSFSEHHAHAAPVPQIRHVLAATDLSPDGNHAVHYAYGLAQSGGVVELCTIVEPHMAAQERHKIEKQLRQLIPHEAQMMGITTHVALIESKDTATAIAQASERLGTETICIGSHGRSGLAHAVMGSVAQQVVHKATQPVLVCRHRNK